ncbi:hypothetical protein Krac_1123 [Ktedonobacter racemifer DSM 44963]|uniref:Uncharacterized protein n=1 Tax=Ktedonobacter racemifer DSM 44963 TaxID=485913 RepID=D6U6A3_KTERA|nr:hypothetical protein Krac_1123 [Ktedonobacter racemifer DSM 44963]
MIAWRVVFLCIPGEMYFLKEYLLQFKSFDARSKYER